MRKTKTQMVTMPSGARAGVSPRYAVKGAAQIKEIYVLQADNALERWYLKRFGRERPLDKLPVWEAGWINTCTWFNRWFSEK